MILVLSRRLKIGKYLVTLSIIIYFFSYYNEKFEFLWQCLKSAALLVSSNEISNLSYFCGNVQKSAAFQASIYENLNLSHFYGNVQKIAALSGSSSEFESLSLLLP